MLSDFFNKVIDIIVKGILYRKFVLRGSKDLVFKDYQCNILDNLYMNGHAIVFNNEFYILGNIHIINDFNNLEELLSSEEQRYLHSFEWLMDLKVIGTFEAREKAKFFLNSWLDNFATLNKKIFKLAYDVNVIANRLYMWNACYVFLNLENHFKLDSQLKEKFFYSYSKQYKHLLFMSGKYKLINKVKIYKALIVGSIFCDKYSKYTAQLVNLLIENLKINLLHDGGHVLRNPEDSLNIMEDLIVIYHFLKINNIAGINAIKENIYKIDPFIRTMRHSDGTLAVFNGSTESSRYRINLLLLLGNTVSSPFNNLKNSNYVSLKTKTSTAIVDIGANIENYSSLMAFEVSVNSGKIISNLGNHKVIRPNCEVGQINNSSLILKDYNNNIINLPTDPRIHLSLRTEDAWKKFEITYLGLKEKYGIKYHHTMYLSQGLDVYILGEHLLDFTGSKKNIKEAWIRLHLHPNIDSIEMYKGSQKILFPLKDKKYFFNSQDSKIRLSKNFYHGREYVGERCYSIDMFFNLDSSPVKLEWSILSVQSLAKLSLKDRNNVLSH